MPLATTIHHPAMLRTVYNDDNIKNAFELILKKGQSSDAFQGCHFHLHLTQDLQNRLLANGIHCQHPSRSWPENYYDTRDFVLAQRNIWLRCRNFNDWTLREVQNLSDGTLRLTDEADFTTIMQRLCELVDQKGGNPTHSTAVPRITNGMFAGTCRVPYDICPVIIASYSVHRMDVQTADGEKIYFDATEMRPGEYYMTCSFAWSNHSDSLAEVVRCFLVDDDGAQTSCCSAHSKVAVSISICCEPLAKILKLEENQSRVLREHPNWISPPSPIQFDFFDDFQDGDVDAS